LEAQVIVCLLILSLTAQQLTWYEHYEQGERAYQRNQFQRALSSFDNALAEKPDPDKMVFTRGTQKIEYKPHYYRALILFKLDQLDDSYRAVQQAFNGPVVPDSPKLQADLSPIMIAYRERIENLYQQTTVLQEQLQRRQRIVFALSQEDFVTAKAELDAAVNDGALNMADLASLIANQAEVRRAANELTERVSQVINRLLESRNPSGAREVLNSNSTALTASEQQDFQQRIDALEKALAAEAEAKVVENPQEVRQREAELERQTQEAQSQLTTFRATVADLEEQKTELAQQVTDAKARNQELQAQLSQETAQVPGPPTAMVTLIPLSHKSVEIRARGLLTVPLQRWQLFLNGEPLDTNIEKDQAEGGLFAIEHSLQLPDYGQHTIQFEVEDRLGRTTSSREMIQIDIPWWLHTYTWMFIAGFILFVFATLMIRSLLAKRRAQLQHFNPYIAGSPVIKEDMFYGRDALLDRIHNAVHKNCFMIHGDRRIGKTSLLHQLKRKLDLNTSQQYRFYTAFIDLQGVTEQDLFHHIMAECLQEATFKQFDANQLSFREDQAESYTVRQFSRDLKQIVAHIKEPERHTVLVLLLDEVDVLNEFSEKTNQKLRGIFMKEYAEHLSCVMAGIGIKKEWESAGSPWYNFFEEIPMHDFDRDAARQLILDPVKGIFTYTPDAIEAILRFCGGKPYLIQKMCVSLIDTKLRNGSFRVEEQDVIAYKDTLTDQQRTPS
jgi:hypothetical protein